MNQRGGGMGEGGGVSLTFLGFLFYFFWQLIWMATCLYAIKGAKGNPWMAKHAAVTPNWFETNSSLCDCTGVALISHFILIVLAQQLQRRSSRRKTTLFHITFCYLLYVSFRLRRGRRRRSLHSATLFFFPLQKCSLDKERKVGQILKLSFAWIVPLITWHLSCRLTQAQSSASSLLCKYQKIKRIKKKWNELTASWWMQRV